MLPFRLLLLAALASLLLASCRADNECAVAEGQNCANPEAVTDDTRNGANMETETGGTVSEDPNCPSRDLIIRCAAENLDTNKNGKLERSELETAIKRLPWYSRSVLQILGSVDKIMAKCDMDGDDAISMDLDMEQNKDQCLATCFKRRAFKGAFFPDCE